MALAARPTRRAGHAQGRSLGAGFGRLGGTGSRQPRPADFQKADLFRQAVDRGFDEANARTSFEMAMLQDEGFLKSMGF